MRPRTRHHSGFAAVRVRPAHRDYKRTEPYPEEWLLIEWPKKESEPTKYWLSTLPAKASLKSLVKIAKHRWIIERSARRAIDSSSWRPTVRPGLSALDADCGEHGPLLTAVIDDAACIGCTLCIAAYGFLISERNRFPPSVRAGHVGLPAPEPPPDFRPRGSPRPPRTA